MLYNKSELSNFCKTALMAQGVSEKNAQVTTALLIEADEMGIHSHGVKNLHVGETQPCLPNRGHQ